MRNLRLLSGLTGVLLLLAEPRKRCLLQHQERQGLPSEAPAAALAPSRKLSNYIARANDRR